MNKDLPPPINELPQARVKRWTFPIVWLVPMVAALVAGFLVYHRIREFGPEIAIYFAKAEGIKSGQSFLQYRGVPVGEVNSVELSPDARHAIVKVKLRRSAKSVAREGSAFWIVRPELEMGNITGLGTIIAGPHIEVWPGHGAAKTTFYGVERSPVTLEPNGLKLTLLAPQAGSLGAGTPVYYRGIEVGAVQQCQLSTNADAIQINVVIKQRYAPLVRSGSKFWNVTGVDAKFGLFRGAEINIESLKSLLIGGVAFATPNDQKSLARVPDGAVFRLHDSPQSEWLEWRPILALPPSEAAETETNEEETSQRRLRLPTPPLQ